MRKRFFYVLLIFLGLAPTSALHAQKSSVSNVLFVGNSYVMRVNIHEIVSQICGDLGMEISSTLSAAEGATLNDHWNQRRELKTISLIESGDFDLIILQDQSRRPLRDKTGMHEDIAAFADLAAKHGAELALFSTWARKRASRSQQEKISDAYREAAETNHALLLPIGDEWQRVKEEYPELDLYTSDNSHPSKLGAYLSALIICAELRSGIDESEFGLAIDRLVELRQEDREFLKEFVILSNNL